MCTHLDQYPMLCLHGVFAAEVLWLSSKHDDDDNVQRMT